MGKKRKGYGFIGPKKCKERLKNNQCPICGKHKDQWNRRKDWTCCSKKCTKKYQSYFVTWQQIRHLAFERDKFKCLECGCQPKEVRRHKGWIPRLRMQNKIINGNSTTIGWYCDLKNRLEYVIEVDISKLNGDHIVPVSIGGAELDVNNVQTLCVKCHKEKTKYDLKLIREEKERLKKERKTRKKKAKKKEIKRSKKFKRRLRKYR